MASDIADQEWFSQQTQKRKNAKRKRLAYMFLDVFLGGFIVRIVLMSTLGKPIAEEPAMGGGGEAFILVEFEWDSFETRTVAQGLSPVIKYNGTDLKPGGFASPYNETLPIWVDHSRETGIIDKRKLYASPFENISVEGFHLATIDNPMRVMTITGLGRQYGYIWISKPCKGQWEFGMRGVGPSITATQPINIRYRVSYGDKVLNSPRQSIRGSGTAAEDWIFQSLRLADGNLTFSVTAEWDDDDFNGCS